MTNFHLAKAQAALAAAAELDTALDQEALPKAYMRLLDLAQVQAQVAQAEALTAIAASLRILVRPGRDN